jgi:hypothetical protein
VARRRNGLLGLAVTRSRSSDHGLRLADLTRPRIDGLGRETIVPFSVPDASLYENPGPTTCVFLCALEEHAAITLIERGEIRPGSSMAKHEPPDVAHTVNEIEPHFDLVSNVRESPVPQNIAAAPPVSAHVRRC